MSEFAAPMPDELGEPVGPVGPVIRDRRRIDPQTGAVREASDARPDQSTGRAGSAGAGVDGGGELAGGGELTGVRQQLAERTADLQRLQAEYVNYRRRVDRDREAVRDGAVAAVVTGLLPVLDDVGRARAHGELEGGFKAVGEALEAAVAKLGVERYGEPGDAFDPTVHEALTHSYSGDVATATAVAVFQPGYRISGSQGSRIVRPARVAVAEPEPGSPAGTGGGQAAAEPGVGAEAGTSSSTSSSATSSSSGTTTD